MGCFAVGSSAFGFRDSLSDIDLYVVSGGVEKVIQKIKKKLSIQYKILSSSSEKSRNHYKFILGNYVSVDFFFSCQENIQATRSEFKLLFDKVGNLESLMKKSWNKNKNKFHGTYQSVSIDTEYKDAIGKIWKPVSSGIIYARRGMYWKSLSGLEIIRNEIIKLKGLRYNLNTIRYRQLDLFPKEDLAQIKKLLKYDFSEKGMIKSICLAMDIFFNECALYFGEYEFGEDKLVAREYDKLAKLVQHIKTQKL